MEMNDMAFFHEGTLRICGSLDMDEVLKQCLTFLKQFMPISGILLDVFEPEIGSLRNIAMISDLELNRLEKPIRLSDNQKKQLRSQTNKGAIISYDDSDPISIKLTEALGLKEVSYNVLHLMLDDKRLGVVILFAQGKNRFTFEHKHLLELLHDPFAIAMSNIRRFHELMRLKEILKDDNRYLHHELHVLSGDEIIGEKFGLKNVMSMVRQVARLDSNVLLMGETGVGKEVIANAIHFLSPRGSGPLIKVNCGAIPENLLDSELFGHEKGAFTGALARKRGRFERAHRGTIFLDEIGELQPGAQVRLLRVIQDRLIERVGGTQPIPVDVRIIAATNRNLEKMVQEGFFREDLWFRLNVFPIHVPPLRQRKTDIPALVNYFIERKSHEMKLRYRPQVERSTLEQLKLYEWPGNVRELENCVERELIRSQTRLPRSPLKFNDFLTTVANDSFSDKPERIIGEEQIMELQSVVRLHLERALKLSKGQIQGRYGAAARLGINPSTLRHKLRKLGIPFGRVK